MGCSISAVVLLLAKGVCNEMHGRCEQGVDGSKREGWRKRTVLTCASGRIYDFPPPNNQLDVYNSMCNEMGRCEQGVEGSKRGGGSRLSHLC